MRKSFIILFILFTSFQIRAQILNVPEVIQEQNQWCWAGSSNCILKYYGFNFQQCDLAEYARTVITWHNFGTTNCCTDPSQGCNYWNYNYGYTGSIQDILIHFGSIANTGYGSPLTEPEVTAELSINRPFVIRWGWYSGGGHFIVGHGLSGGSMYYMDPWMGEGLKISTYSWVLDNSVHYWSHTNRMDVSGIEENDGNSLSPMAYPNPSDGEITLDLGTQNTKDLKIQITDATGKTIGSEMNYIPGMKISLKENGIYLIQISGTDFQKTEKVVVCK